MNHSVSSRSGPWLTLAAVVAVLVWRLVVVIAGPHRLMAIAEEVGSIPLFRQDVFPNSKGTCLVYTRETESGIGLYFLDAATGDSKLLDEQQEKDWSEHFFGMLGWATDDGLFAYAYPPRSANRPEEEVVICDGKTGDVVARISVDAGVWQGAWLSPLSLACLTYNKDLSVIERKPDGKWARTRNAPQVTSADVGSFVAISPTAVAWQVKGQKSQIWLLDYTAKSPVKIWESETNALQAFSYSRSRGEYQLVCNDTKGWYTIRFRPASEANQNEIHYMTREEERPRYAVLEKAGGTATFHIKLDSASKPTTLEWPGAVEDYSGKAAVYEGSGKFLFGDYLYFVGDRTDTATSLWQYDVKKESVRCLVSSTKGGLKRATIINPVSSAFTNSAGIEMNYHVWEPRLKSPGKKHPLILAQMTYIWLPYYQLAARERYYFALADRHYWNDPKIYNWSDDILKLYETMAKNPDVDTNQVYVYACSWETSFLTELLARKPGLFKGIIMADPGQLPQPDSSPRSVLILVGGDDDNGEAVKRARQYQDEAYKLGIPVKLAVQDGSQHIPKSIKTERERTEQFARFLHEEQLASQ